MSVAQRVLYVVAVVALVLFVVGRAANLLLGSINVLGIAMLVFAVLAIHGMAKRTSAGIRRAKFVFFLTGALGVIGTGIALFAGGGATDPLMFTLHVVNGGLSVVLLGLWGALEVSQLDQHFHG